MCSLHASVWYTQQINKYLSSSTMLVEDDHRQQVTLDMGQAAAVEACWHDMVY
jgi:hypothetical protein